MLLSVIVASALQLLNALDQFGSVMLTSYQKAHASLAFVGKKFNASAGNSGPLEMRTGVNSHRFIFSHQLAAYRVLL